MRVTSPTAARLSALRIADPPAWWRAVREALERADSVPAAAKSLGVSERTLWRWASADTSLTRGLELRGAGRPWPAQDVAQKP
jgi:hypothetical protein